MPATRSATSKRAKTSNLNNNQYDQPAFCPLLAPQEDTFAGTSDSNDDLAGAVTSDELFGHLVDHFRQYLKQRVAEHNRQCQELKAENERCKQERRELEQEAETLRQELRTQRDTARRDKNTWTQEKDSWNQEKDQWRTHAHELRTELSERDRTVEQLQNTSKAREKAIETIANDTFQFWEKAQASHDKIVKQTQRVLFFQLGQLMRENEAPKPIEEVVDILMQEEND